MSVVPNAGDGKVTVPALLQRKSAADSPSAKIICLTAYDYPTARLVDEAGVDVVVDFTTPEAAVENMRAVLALGGRIVVGTTGWYAKLNEMKAHAIQRGGGLLYGTNFSIGVQKLFQLTAELAKLEGYQFLIDETHHTSKLDAPSGTALTLKEIILSAQPGVNVPVESHRVGDAKGEHIVRAVSDHDTLELRHDAHSRRGFALGAVRGAEWLCGKQGAWEFREIFDQL